MVFNRANDKNNTNTNTNTNNSNYKPYNLKDSIKQSVIFSTFKPYIRRYLQRLNLKKNNKK